MVQPKKGTGRKRFLLKTAVDFYFVRGYRIVPVWGTGRAVCPPLVRRDDTPIEPEDVGRPTHHYYSIKSMKSGVEPPSGCFVLPNYKVRHCWECPSLLSIVQGKIKLCWGCWLWRTRQHVRRIKMIWGIKGKRKDHEVVWNDGIDLPLSERAELFVEDGLKKIKPKGKNIDWSSLTAKDEYLGGWRNDERYEPRTEKRKRKPSRKRDTTARDNRGERCTWSGGKMETYHQEDSQTHPGP